MTEIYEAWHYMVGPDGAPDKNDEEQSAKRLSEYTTRARAEAAIGRRRDEKGFRDWPHGFRIEVMPLDVGFPPGPGGPLARTYDLWHFRIGRDDKDDIDEPAQRPTKIGAFSSERTAKAAIERFTSDPRFSDFPDGFRIDSAPPDIDHWDGGFISWDEA